MDTVRAFIGVGLFGLIGMFLFFSVVFGANAPSSTAKLVKNPRFVGGCICLLLTALCAAAML